MNLELKNFKYWLSAKDSNEIVGERRDSCKCPIANWLNDTNNLSGRKVSVNHYYIYISPTETLLANRWMRRFIMYTDTPNSPLCNVEEALFTLAKIEN